MDICGTTKPDMNVVRKAPAVLDQPVAVMVGLVQRTVSQQNLVEYARPLMELKELIQQMTL